MKYANHLGYTDINPFEVVRAVSDKTLVIRQMDAERDPAWKPEFVAGGFSGVCTNQMQQQWIITSNESYSEERIRLNRKGEWRDKHGRRFELGTAPVKFYDYNF